MGRDAAFSRLERLGAWKVNSEADSVEDSIGSSTEDPMPLVSPSVVSVREDFCQILS